MGTPQRSRYRATSKARAAILRRQASDFMASGRGRLPYKMGRKLKGRARIVILWAAENKASRS